MNKKKLRKWNNILHRDIGYFFFGLTLVYAISGLAMNHKVMNHWNPEYIVKNYSFSSAKDMSKANVDEEKIKLFLDELGEKNNLKKFYYPDENTLKIFLKGGFLVFDVKNGVGEIETARKRAVFHQVDWLHYNPNIWWTVFSDIYAVALILLAITGLFVRRGKNGIKWRGAILASVGLLIPILFLIFFF